MKLSGETRPLRNDFAGETLYKRIEPDEVPHIRPDGLATTQRVTLPGLSCWRSRHMTPEQLAATCECGVYAMPADDLPAPVPGKMRDGRLDTTYTFRAVDDPQRTDEAHCQVWVFADDVPVVSEDPIPAKRRRKLKEALASKLRRL